MSIDVKQAMDRVRQLHPALRLQVLAALLGGCGEAYKHRPAVTEKDFASMLELALQMCEKANAEHEQRQAEERPHQAIGRIVRQQRGEGL